MASWERFDFEGYRACLLDLGRSGWQYLCQHYPGERFYVYGFETHPLLSSCYPIGNSEEGLHCQAERWVAKKYSADLDSARNTIRWSPAEWPYNSELVNAFDRHPILKYGDQVLEVVDSMEPREKEAAFDAFYARLYEVHHGVLNQLRHEGLFGADTEHLLTNLFHFDQSDEGHLQHARHCNPPAIYARYESDLMPPELHTLLDLYRRLGVPSHSDRAYSHFRGDEAVLAETAFQRAALKLIHESHDFRWMEEAKGPARKDDALDQSFRSALERIRAQDVDSWDLNCVVRRMQYEVIFYLCHMLDYPSSDVPECQDVRWGLFTIDREGKPLTRLHGLATNLYAYFERVSQENERQGPERQNGPEE